jgi:hypothetical protein
MSGRQPATQHRFPGGLSLRICLKLGYIISIWGFPKSWASHGGSSSHHGYTKWSSMTGIHGHCFNTHRCHRCTVPQDFTSRMSEEQCHMAGSLVGWTLKVCVSGIRPAKSGMQPICMSYNILEVEFIFHWNCHIGSNSFATFPSPFCIFGVFYNARVVVKSNGGVTIARAALQPVVLLDFAFMWLPGKALHSAAAWFKLKIYLSHDRRVGQCILSMVSPKSLQQFHGTKQTTLCISMSFVQTSPYTTMICQKDPWFYNQQHFDKALNAPLPPSCQEDDGWWYVALFLLLKHIKSITPQLNKNRTMPEVGWMFKVQIPSSTTSPGTSRNCLQVKVETKNEFNQPSTMLIRIPSI